MKENRNTPGWRTRSVAALCGLMILGIALDASFKTWARMWLTPHEPVALLPGVNLSLGFNPGVAFGLFASNSTLEQIITVLVQFGLVAGLFVLFIRAGKVAQYCYAAIVSGAVGNLVDRLLMGAVTDYIDVYAGAWHWPTFNLADTLIALGVAGLIGWDFFNSRHSTRHDIVSQVKQ